MIRLLLLLALSFLAFNTQAKSSIAQGCLNQDPLLIHLDDHGWPHYVQGNGVMNRALTGPNGWHLKTLPEGTLLPLELEGELALEGKPLNRFEPLDDQSILTKALGEWRNEAGDSLVIFKHPAGYGIGNQHWETSITALDTDNWLLGDGRKVTWENSQLQLSASPCSQTDNKSNYQFHRAWDATQEVIHWETGHIGIQVFSPETEVKGNIIIVHGSAPFEAAWYQLQAWWFVKAGYRAITFDKRVGASSGDPFTSSVHDFAADVQQIIKHLRYKYPDQSVGLWGISQGGAVISLTDSNDPILKPDFALVVSTPGYAFRQQELYRRTHVYQNLGYSDAYATMGNRWWTMAFDMVIQISAGEFPNLGVRDFLDLNTDWSDTWGKVSFPTLLMFGKKDTLVEPGRAAAAIAKARQQNKLAPVSIMTFESASHGMKLTRSGSFFEDNNQFAPGYVDFMMNWANNYKQATSENSIQVLADDHLQTQFETGAEWGRPGLFAGIWAQTYWSLIMLVMILIQLFFSIRHKSLLLFLATSTALASITCFNLLITNYLLPQLQIPDQAEPTDFLLTMRVLATTSVALLLGTIGLELFKAYSIQRKAKFYCWFTLIFFCVYLAWLIYWRIIL